MWLLVLPLLTFVWFLKKARQNWQQDRMGEFSSQDDTLKYRSNRVELDRGKEATPNVFQLLLFICLILFCICSVPDVKTPLLRDNSSLVVASLPARDSYSNELHSLVLIDSVMPDASNQISCMESVKNAASTASSTSSHFTSTSAYSASSTSHYSSTLAPSPPAPSYQETEQQGDPLDVPTASSMAANDPEGRNALFFTAILLSSLLMMLFSVKKWFSCTKCGDWLIFLGYLGLSLVGIFPVDDFPPRSGDRHPRYEVLICGLFDWGRKIPEILHELGGVLFLLVPNVIYAFILSSERIYPETDFYLVFVIISCACFFVIVVFFTCYGFLSSLGRRPVWEDLCPSLLFLTFSLFLLSPIILLSHQFSFPFTLFNCSFPPFSLLAAFWYMGFLSISIIHSFSFFFVPSFCLFSQRSDRRGMHVRILTVELICFPPDFSYYVILECILLANTWN